MKKKNGFLIIILISIILGCLGFVIYKLLYKNNEETIQTLETEHIHIFSDNYSFDETYHFYQAICHKNIYKDKSEHIFNEWNIITFPTVNSTGLKRRTCQICSYYEEMIIPKMEEVSLPLFEIEDKVLKSYNPKQDEITDIIIIPEVDKIATRVFMNNHNIKAVYLPHSLTYIENNAFSYCHNLEYVVMDKNVTNIGGSAFGNCEKFTRIYYLGSEQEYNSINMTNTSFDKENVTIYYYSEIYKEGNYWHYVNNLPQIYQ